MSARLPVLPDDLTDDELPQRPKTRGGGADGPRPCPWYGCKHHLGLDVHPAAGPIKIAIVTGRLDYKADGLAPFC